MTSGTTGGRGLTADQMQAAIASLRTPDVVESPFGALRYFDGVPLPETATTIYDALDLMRGIEVFLNSVPGRRWSRFAAASARSGSPRRASSPTATRAPTRGVSR